MDFKLITNSLEGWFGFIKVNYKDLFKKFFVVNLYVFAAIIVGLLIAGLGFLAFGGTSIVSNVAIIIGAVSLLLFVVLIATLFSLAVYRITDEAHKRNNKVSIISLALQKAPAFVLYLIASAIILALFSLPFAIVGFALMSIFNLDMMVVFYTAEFGFILGAIFFGLFMHFTIYELVISNKGVFESIKDSYSLVRGKLLETIVFLFILAALESLISIPFVLVFYLILIGFGIIGGILGVLISSIMPTISIFVFVILGVIGALLIIAFILASVSVQYLVTFPLSYRFWKNLLGEPIADKPKLSTEQKAALASRIKSVTRKKTSK